MVVCVAFREVRSHAASGSDEMRLFDADGKAGMALRASVFGVG